MVEQVYRDKYLFYVDGKCVPKGRPRFFTNKKTGLVEVYTPKKTQDYEKLVAESARLSIEQPIDKYCRVTLKIFFAPPKSWTKKKKQMAFDDQIKPHVGDIDNFAKSILDGMNKIALTDDKLIYDLRVEKKYSEKDGVYVLIEPLKESE